MRRGVVALAVVLTAAGRAGAHEDGNRVTFGGGLPDSSFRPGSAAGALELGPSDPVGEAFDTVLWHGVLRGDVSFSARRCDASGACTPWVPALLRTFGGGRFWARVDLPSAAPGTVTLRVGGKAQDSAPGAEIDFFGIEAFARGSAPPPAAGGGAGSPSPEAAPGSDAQKPPVVGRGQWGAKPQRGEPQGHTPERITQHHTEGRQTWSLSESMEEIRAIQSYHQEGRGWADIGYHFLMDAEGRIFQGRPETIQGAHTRNSNAGNVGIALLGSHHPPKNHPITAAQRAALRDLGRWLVAAYRIKSATYKGHRDYVATTCPGDHLYRALPEIRDSWKESKAGPLLAVPPPSLGLLSLGARRLFDGR